MCWNRYVPAHLWSPPLSTNYGDTSREKPQPWAGVGIVKVNHALGKLLPTRIPHACRSVKIEWVREVIHITRAVTLATLHEKGEVEHFATVK